MTLVRDVLARDPSSWLIPNLGVAKVGQPRTEEEWSVLRYELDAFVAEGEYATGLDRVLQGFLTNLDKPSQPAVWVSGFYREREVAPDPRARVALGGPRSSRTVHEPVAWCTCPTRSQRSSGSSTPAGSSSAAGSRRRACSVPAARASDCRSSRSCSRPLACRKTTRRPALSCGSARRGCSTRSEATCSPGADRLRPNSRTCTCPSDWPRRSLAARPTFATSVAEASKALRTQFPSDKTIDESTFLQVLDEALRSTNRPAKSRSPSSCSTSSNSSWVTTTDRVNEASQLVEACCSEFRSRILFVGAGQMSLGATPMLQKLLHRFTVSVALQDRDMDRVVRSVVLRKRPERLKEIEAVLDQVSGEISRQLAGSGIAPTGADREFLVADYPLAPGAAASMGALPSGGRHRRSRRPVADPDARGARCHAGGRRARDLGVVVPADRIYDEQESALQQSGALPAVTAELIADLAKDTEHGVLASRVAKAVYIIGKLPKDGPSATGLRATNDTIADLLIEDLRTDGARMRERVPVITRRLVERGIFDSVDGAYLLQTPDAARVGGGLPGPHPGPPHRRALAG